jgi:hypothetical protein
MTVNIFKVSNFENWGNLIKAWARGQEPLPRTRAEFEQQCQAKQVGAQFPPEMKTVQFVQCNIETLLVRLPPASMLDAAEADLKAGGTYDFPDFYSTDAFGGKAASVAPAVALKFNAERIGDYTIGNCI